MRLIAKRPPSISGRTRSITTRCLPSTSIMRFPALHSIRLSTKKHTPLPGAAGIASGAPGCRATYSVYRIAPRIPQPPSHPSGGEGGTAPTFLPRGRQLLMGNYPAAGAATANIVDSCRPWKNAMAKMSLSPEVTLERSLARMVHRLREAAEDNLLGVATYGAPAKSRHASGTGAAEVNILVVVAKATLQALLPLAPVLTSAQRPSQGSC